jgi:hypothetical protein
MARVSAARVSSTPPRVRAKGKKPLRADVSSHSGGSLSSDFIRELRHHRGLPLIFPFQPSYVFASPSLPIIPPDPPTHRPSVRASVRLSPRLLPSSEGPLSSSVQFHLPLYAKDTARRRGGMRYRFYFSRGHIPAAGYAKNINFLRSPGAGWGRRHGIKAATSRAAAFIVTGKSFVGKVLYKPIASDFRPSPLTAINVLSYCLCEPA